MKSKIKTVEELELFHPMKVVQCHGVFDILHPGHRAHLKEARSLGDILIVSITSDRCVNKGPNHPAFNERIRAEAIADLDYVDYVIINDEFLPDNLIRAIKPDVYCKGKDYTDVPERAIVESYGGRVHFTSEPLLSSTHILNNHFEVYPEGTKEFLKNFPYKPDEVINQLEGLGRLKVLVIGDAIIDKYVYSSSIGKSPKDNIMVVRYLSEENFAGGVLATANHIANFADVTLVTCLGALNTQEGYIRKRLNPKIETKFFYREDVQTSVKVRYVEPSKLTKIFGVSYVEDYPMPLRVSDSVCEFIKDQKPDLIVVNDFGHGFINQDIRDTLEGFICLNVQTNTDNSGFNLVCSYQRADFVCLDEPEIRLACQNKYEKLETLIQNITDKLSCKKMIVTHGQHDTIAFDGNFYHIPIFSKDVKDTTGAGDAFFSITSLCVRNEMPMEMVGFVGNAVGALKVRTVCNRNPIDKKELYKFIGALLK